MKPPSPPSDAPDHDDDRRLPALRVEHEASRRITQAILDFIAQIPASHQAATPDPAAQARQLTRAAAQRAALTAGTLALPPGPLGWLTMLPELVAIWKLQAQLVSDIASAFGQHAELGREQMLYCLFRHTAAQAVRDLGVRLGDRLLFRPASQAVMERLAHQLGVRLGRRAMGEGLARWLPVVGALGVGAYAYADTRQVASTAIALFETGSATAGE